MVEEELKDQLNFAIKGVKRVNKCNKSACGPKALDLLYIRLKKENDIWEEWAYFEMFKQAYSNDNGWFALYLDVIFYQNHILNL